jgi:hypothetical protein
METLLLRFKVNVHDPSLPSYWLGSGPIFHRWLPDGEKDAIVLDTGEPDVDLKVWFERLGFVDGYHHGIVFDEERREVSPDVMRTQGVLAAGPLVGSLEIRGLREGAVAAVRGDGVMDAEYVGLGKRVVSNLLVPHVNRFLRILRVNYGQHWIVELEEWDSRYRSLAEYCERPLGLTWSPDGGDTWKPFHPGPGEGGGRARHDGRPFPQLLREYLAEADWRQLGLLIRDGYEPSTGALVLAQAHRFLDLGDVRQAIIEGVCALEVALHEFVRNRLGGARDLAKCMESFWTLPLRAQVVVVATALSGIPEQDIEDSVALVGIRNKILHEGEVVPDDAASRMTGLMNTVVALLSGQIFRFPSFGPGVVIMSLDLWDETWKRLGDSE